MSFGARRGRQWVINLPRTSQDDIVNSKDKNYSRPLSLADAKTAIRNMIPLHK